MKLVLDSEVETAGEEGLQELSWVQAVLSIGIRSYASWKPADYPDSRNQPLSSDRSGHAGPIQYGVSKHGEGKAYMLLYVCSLTRGIYLGPNLETAECPNKAEAVHCALRETGANLLRQRLNLCWFM